MAPRSLPPRTPKKYKKRPGHARTEPKPKDTPRSLPSLAPLIKAHRLRVKIAELMNSETLVCTPDEFMDRYMPPRDEGTTQQVLDLLLDAGILVPRNANLPTATESTQGAYRYVFKVFQQKPSEVKKGTKKRPQGDNGEISDKTVNEILMFDNLGEVGQAILEALKNVEGVKTNGHQIRMCPHKPVTSTIEGHGHRIDASLTSNLDKKIPLLVTDIIIPFEFKLTLTNEDGNRQQLVCQINHTMNDDPRRLWVYGMTIEDDQVTIWYFSRSHSMMSMSFSFLDRADLLVEMLVSFFCATDEQLGIDPNVKLVAKDKYVYRFPSDATNPEPAYYYTVDSIVEYRPQRLRCRGTRLWKVTQVKSFDNYDRISDKDLVLKEVFLNNDAPSEMDIQQKLFEDVKKFRGDKGWRQREILSAFSAESKRTLGTALKDFKKYFSCAIRQHSGHPGLEVSPKARAVPNIFPVYTPPPEQPLGTTVRHMSGTQSALEQARMKKSTRNKPSEIKADPDSLTPRRPCRVLFENVCTPLHDIPTLGEAIDILKQCVIALQIMFCAGWVHRDISAGNILALRGKRGKWQVKLSDLEYAKRFPSNAPASSQPKTGTPYFMPLEILMKTLLVRPEYDRVINMGIERTPTIVAPRIVIHGFQHDLESVWWIILWLITMRVAEDLPRKFGKRVFRNNPMVGARKAVLDEMELYERQDLIDSLPAPLKGSSFVVALDNLRRNLVTDYLNRNRDKTHDDLTTYSWIIGEGFKLFFNHVSRTQKEWTNIEMMEKMMTAEDFEVLEDSSDYAEPPSPTPAVGRSSKKPRL
ncbi:other/FunK1 protein kinase [Coprinopsis cinerea okayama7|uniref:Other/FunK1 protein kinase n=1 Tax=Coprinopsis cinerea (strain Okayama-7 / 130 / ATCC MYA-4618 / FGSC 9003) TaxID=240176 RepID=A8NB14_COPC7|nr:other/FunK1 protein kinase [Coprinopsis cinerea okayama7\|eukprot:XP_001832016.2 other/FunK1 protein kinase [Coprinopsis cinerea okayama7\